MPDTQVFSSLWDLVLSWQPDLVTVSVITGHEGPEAAHPAVTPGVVHSQTGTRHCSSCSTGDRSKAGQWSGGLKFSSTSSKM